MDFRLMPWAHFHRWHDYFRVFHWLHPRLYRQASTRGLLQAIRNGDLFECERRPWLTASPALLFALRGRAPLAGQWRRLLRGPAAHESLILRTASPVLDWPGARLRVDEAIQEASPPGAWGSACQLVPDIEVAFEDPLLPRLWIECERTLRPPGHYASRVSRLPRHVIVYVVHGELQRMRLADRLGLTECPRPLPERVRVMTEVQWILFSKRFGKRLAKLREHPCLHEAGLHPTAGLQIPRN